MPTATIESTTPTRRSAMCISLAALTAGLTAPAQAAPAANPEATLIDLCNRLVAAETEECLLIDHDAYAPDFGPNHARSNQLNEERERLEGLIEECEAPASAAGFAAIARAALTWATRDHNGEIQCQDFGEQRLVMLAEGVAGGFVWPPRPGTCSTAQWASPTSPEEVAAHCAAHNAQMASINAKIKADKGAWVAEFERSMTPSLMTDEKLLAQTKVAREFNAATAQRASELEAEMAQRGLV
jgi:hypothetical protein